LETAKKIKTPHTVEIVTLFKDKAGQEKARTITIKKDCAKSTVQP